MRDVDRIDFDKRIQSYGIHLLACYIVNLVYLSQNVLSCQLVVCSLCKWELVGKNFNKFV